jgi:hypothetical protein
VPEFDFEVTIKDMSSGRRAYDMLRGYVNHHMDRIRDVDVSAAWDELNESISGPRGTTAETEPANIPAPEPVDQKTIARRILGVKEDASFEDIRKSYERLRKRSDPTNFPEGTDERKTAQELHQRIETAYRILSADVPAIDKRFKNLEIE